MICLAAQCDRRDLAGPFEQVLEAGGESVAAWEQPLVGRIGIDYGLRNTGTSAADFLIRARVQTSGDAYDDGCARLLQTTGRTIAATPWPHDAAGIPDDVSELSGVSDSGAWFIDASDLGTDEDGLFTVTLTSSTWLFYLDTSDPDVTIAVTDEVGADFRREDRELLENDCNGAGTVWRYDLNADTYVLRVFNPNNAQWRFVVEEACEAQRAVSSSCAGTEGPVIEEAVRLSSGGFVQGRLTATELGVGDRAVIELSCSEDDGGTDCSGSIQSFFVIEPLDCRDDDECTAAQSCDSAGYCLRTTTTGCRAAGSPNAGAPVTLFVLTVLLLWRVLRRRRGRRYIAAGVAAAVAVAFIGVGSDAMAQERREGRRLEVYAQPAISTHLFTGTVGDFSSMSIGLHTIQGININRWGVYLSVGSDFFLTTQPPPPYTRGLQAYQLKVGGRYGIPLGRLQPGFGVEYTSVSVASNSLNRFLGDELHYNGVGGHISVRADIMRPVFVEIRGTGSWIVDAKTPTGMFGVLFAIGIAGVL